MEITDILTSDGYIIVNKELIKEYGLNEAIMIGELSAEYNYYKQKNEINEDGSFYSTVENIEKNTSLSKYQQAKALNTLIEKELISVDYKGIPPKRYIIQHFEKIIDLYKSKNLTFKSQKTSPLKVKKVDGNNNNKNNNKNNNNIKKFIPPTLEEIKAYIDEKKLSIIAEDFYNYFDTGNWIDSKGNKVKNWKQKLLTWDNYRKKSKKEDTNFTSRNYTDLNQFFSN